MAKSPFDRFSRSLLQPLLVVVDRGDDGVVGLLEFCQERFVGDGGKRRGHSGLEEPAIAVHLLDGDLGVDTRRILEILARLGKRCGHRLLARDQLPQALVRRRELPLDHDVGGAGQAAAVAVGIAAHGRTISSVNSRESIARSSCSRSS